MTVWRSHIWYEHGALQCELLTGWQVPHGPYKGAVLVRFPGDVGLPRVVSGSGWHSDRLSAELEVASALRRIADAARDKAARIQDGE